jgi:hypothetical protein
MQINQKRAYVLIIIAAVLLTISFGIYKAAERYSSRIELYDVINLESQAPGLIQAHMNAGSFTGEVLSCQVFAQNNQLFAFFDYKPFEDNPVIFQMPKRVIERCIFYGYAKIEKKFSKYNIVDFSTSSYDNAIELKGASKLGGGWNDVNERYRAYGKILDDDVYKIEFYINDVLAGTYNVGDKDYFFIELEGSIGHIEYKFYGKDNSVLYE